MAMGIDSLVEAKKNMYANNPEGLQKKAQLSGALLDALAMQKLVAEKQSAKNQLAMAMQNNPKTIVEQNEETAKKNSLSEVMEGVSGVLGQQENERQQNLAQAGQPQQPQPQSAGIAGQPKPNMQGFARGGIVGYAQGRKVANPLGVPYDELTPFQKLFSSRKPEAAPGSEEIKKRKEDAINPLSNEEARLIKEYGIDPRVFNKKSFERMEESDNLGNVSNKETPKEVAKPFEPNMRDRNMRVPGMTPPKPDDTPKEGTGLPSVNPNSNYEAEMDRLMAVLSAGYGNFGKANARYKQATKQAGINAEQRDIDNEVSRTDLDIKKEANRLKDTYYKELIRERGINNANKELTKLTTTYQEGLESSPAYSLVREAQARFRVLEEDSTIGPFEIGREGKLRAQQEKINAAINYAQQQYAAGEGREITTRLAALKATLAEYEGNSGFTVKR